MESFEGYDVDWFVFDETNALVHFASGGGFLPNFIVDSHMRLAQEILSLPIISPEVEVSPVLRALVSFSNNKEFTDYISPFTEYAKRGLFSYDKTEINNHEDPIYHLVASPFVTLPIFNIPASIISSIYKIDTFSAKKQLQTNVSDFI